MQAAMMGLTTRIRDTVTPTVFDVNRLGLNVRIIVSKSSLRGGFRRAVNGG